MSQVVSSQPLPNSTSQENAAGTQSAAETGVDMGDCGCRVDRSYGCFMYYCCNFLDRICGGAGASIESCANCCGSCLTCCWEDEDGNKGRRYYNDHSTWSMAYSGEPYYTSEYSGHHNHHHSSSHCDTGGHGGHHDSGWGGHHDSGWGGHHDSGWGGDSGGGTCDSGWGGDSGGGCDSGGGGDSGGGCTD